MKYENEPRPEIEQHYHIRELIEGQEKRVADKNLHKQREQERDERNSLIRGVQDIVITDFWCDKCKEDFKAQVIKQVEQDWSDSTQNVAFYKTKCFKGHWCIRLITDKHLDPFFHKSKLLFKDRENHLNDIIQPWETGFNLLYGKKINK